jgi:hypothetical protein
VPGRHQIPAHILSGPHQIPGRFLFHTRHGDRDDLSQMQQPGQVPGITHISLDPIPDGRCSFDGAATQHSIPRPARNRANPNPVGPAS